MCNVKYVPIVVDHSTEVIYETRELRKLPLSSAVHVPVSRLLVSFLGFKFYRLFLAIKQLSNRTSPSGENIGPGLVRPPHL